MSNFIVYKIGCKSMKTVHSFNLSFKQGNINKCAAQHWFQTFHDCDESFEDEDGGVYFSVIDNNNN